MFLIISVVCINCNMYKSYKLMVEKKLLLNFTVILQYLSVKFYGSLIFIANLQEISINVYINGIKL